MNKNEVIAGKIHTCQTLKPFLNTWRFKGSKIVFTNGCFDLLHLGHIDYLAKAANLGNLLIVGVNTDSSVSRIKGPGRPVNSETTRLNVLASLFFVNAVILFDEPTPYELVKFIEPDVLVKGGDWKKEDIVGYDLVTKNGGKVETIEYLEGYSTTAIIKKILQFDQINQDTSVKQK
jgi:rfaE bifunctional protein nucleotidyltransferase chain/domain